MNGFPIGREESARRRVEAAARVGDGALSVAAGRPSRPLPLAADAIAAVVGARHTR